MGMPKRLPNRYPALYEAGPIRYAMKALHKSLLFCLTGTLVINIAVAANVLSLKQQLSRRSLDAIAPIVSGVMLNGTQWQTRDASCHVVRFTKDDCPHCKADTSSYTEFLKLAKRHGCEVIEIAPRAGKMRAREWFS
jgi:hypothetical protein